jgi:hypothetical protein
MRPSALAVITALITVPAFAQRNDWSRIGTLGPQARISAHTYDGKYINGRLTRWTPDGMEVSADRRNQWLRRSDLKQVWAQKKSSRWRATLIGAAVGFSVAFPVGAASAGYLADQNNPKVSTRMGFGAGFGLIGSGIGAGIAALAGATKNVLVYRGEKQ